MLNRGILEFLFKNWFLLFIALVIILLSFFMIAALAPIK